MEYDMVFEGGGAKGMVFIGALQELEARGHKPRRLLGTSAGAILTTLLAAGYDSQEMDLAMRETQQDGQPVFLGFLESPPKLTKEEIQQSAIREMLRSTNFPLVPNFVEDRLDDTIAELILKSPIIGRLCSFNELGGIFAAENFLHWLESKLDSGVYSQDGGNFGKGEQRAFGEMNLGQFHEATGVELSLIASDTSSAQMLVLNHHTAPACPLKWAVRMSMSFPLLWYEVVWQPDWGKYRDQDITGHTVVDGGLLSNFPIELFLSNQKQITRVMGEKDEANVSVLGFLIDELIDVPAAPPLLQESSPFSIFGNFRTVQRVVNLINTMTQAHDNMAIEEYKDFVVHLPARGYGTIEFGMTSERRDALVNAGRSVTRDYFTRVAERESEGTGFEAPVSLEKVDRIAARILYPSRF